MVELSETTVWSTKFATGGSPIWSHNIDSCCILCVVLCVVGQCSLKLYGVV